MDDELDSNGGRRRDNGMLSEREIERWRGRTDEKLSNLQKAADASVITTALISNDVKALQQQVTRLVVFGGIGAFFGSALVSIIVGVAIKMLAGGN